MSPRKAFLDERGAAHPPSDLVTRLSGDDQTQPFSGTAGSQQSSVYPA